VRDVNYLRRSATDRDDRFKLFNPHLPRPALCCFDDVSSESFMYFILGQDAAPLAEIVTQFLAQGTGGSRFDHVQDDK
jgi:hypothetical protein